MSAAQVNAVTPNVERLVEAVRVERCSLRAALCALDGYGLNADAELLAAVLEDMATRDGLLDGSRDPYGVWDAPPRAGVDMLTAALAKVDADIADGIQALGRTR